MGSGSWSCYESGWGGSLLPWGWMAPIEGFLWSVGHVPSWCCLWRNVRALTSCRWAPLSHICTSGSFPLLFCPSSLFFPPLLFIFFSMFAFWDFITRTTIAADLGFHCALCCFGFGWSEPWLGNDCVALGFVDLGLGCVAALYLALSLYGCWQAWFY